MSKTSDSFIITEKNGEYNVLEREILERYALKADVDPSDGSKQVKNDGWTYGDYLLEPKYNPDQLVDLLDLNTYHEACVDVVSKDASGLNFNFHPLSEENTEEFNNQRIIDFFKQMKPGINTLLYRRNYDRRTIGYGAIEIIRDSDSESDVVNLAHIPSHTLRRHRDGKRVCQRVGSKEVWFVIYGQNYDEKGNKCDVHADTGDFYPYNSLTDNERGNELLWSMDYAPGTSYYGRPTIIASLPAILGDLSRGKYNNSFFANYGMPAFAVTITGDFADYEEEPYLDDGSPNPDYHVEETLKYKISKQIKEVIRNPHSAVTILIPSEGEEGNVEAKIQPLSVDTKEASFRLYRKDNRDEVIHAHKVDPSRLGIYESGKLNGSNSKNLDNSYKVSTIAPLKKDNEEDINNLLIKEFDLTDYEFKIDDLDPKDYHNDVQVLKELFNMACATPRQIIDAVGDKFGLTADENNKYLDEYYLNGTPLETLWNNTNSNTIQNEALRSYEDELLGEAKTYDNTNGLEETVINENGLQNISNKEDIKGFKERIRQIINLGK